MKKILFAIAVLVNTIVVMAQDHELTVNDAVPALRFAPLVNYPKKELDLKSLDGKVVILDFWSTQCGSCVASIPHLEEIQEQFKDQLQVVLVSQESPALIDAFFQKRKRLTKNFKAPIVTNDSILSKIFPNDGIPHLVWIGKDRKVKAITTINRFTETNINDLLSKGSLQLPVKQTLTEEEAKDVFRVFKQLTPETLKSYSFLSDPIEGRSGGISHEYKEGYMRILGSNSSIRSLYMYAYRYDVKMPEQQFRNRIIYDVKYLHRFTGFDSIRNDNVVYYYDMRMPVTKKENRYTESTAAMKRQLDDAFSVTSSLVKKKVTCLVIHERKLAKEKGEAVDAEYATDSVFIENAKIETIVHFLQDYGQPGVPIVYEGQRDNESMSFKKGISLADIRELLRLKGFQTEIAERELEFLLIKDR